MFLAPAPSSPAPVVTVLADTAPEWWQVVLDVFTAGGTVGAVIVALYAARKAGRDADGRAKHERAEDRRVADYRWRLDLLLRLGDAFERWDSARLGGAVGDAREPRAQLVALIQAYPDDLPVLQRWLVFDGGHAPAALPELRQLAEAYGPPPQDYGDEYELCRMEIRHWTRGVQTELV